MGAGVLEQGGAVMEPVEMGRGHDPSSQARRPARPSAWVPTSSHLTLPGWRVSQHPKKGVKMGPMHPASLGANSAQ